MMYRLFLIFSVALFALSGQHTHASNKENPDKNPVLGTKQTYRPLSKYKEKKPAPAKAITSLRPRVKSQILALIKKVHEKPNNKSLRQTLVRALDKVELYQLLVNEALPYNDQLDKKTLLLLVNALTQREQHKDAVKILSSLSEKYPNDAEVQLKLGEAYYTLREANEAVIALRESIKINPKQIAPYETLLDLFKETQNSYEARVLLKQMVSLFGEKPPFLTQLCKLSFQDEFHQEAVDYCTKAIKKDPQKGENLTYLGLLKIKLDEPNLGEKYLVEAAKRYSKNEFCQRAAGQMYFEKKNYYVAKRYFQSAIQADNKQFLAHLGLAQTYFAIDDYKNSLLEFEKACQLNQPETKTPFQVAANILRQKKNYDWMKPFDVKSKRCRFVDLTKIK